MTGAVRLWGRWVAANALAELVGLGAVALVAMSVAQAVPQPVPRPLHLALSIGLVALGAFEGWVVGSCQAAVLREVWPRLTGWTRATVQGAVLSWALGMLPSIVMTLATPHDAAPPSEITGPMRWLLAAALGAVTGPMLALFPWRRLRTVAPHGAGWWLASHAAAWALGMPLVFEGVHQAVELALPEAAAVAVLTLALAGAVVGAVHGLALAAIAAASRPAPPHPASS